MQTIAQALALGLQHQRAGQLPQAEQIYRQVLAVAPGNTAALLHLAQLAVETGHASEGVALIEQALALEPANSVLHGSLGVALSAAGRWSEARASLERAVACDPANRDAQYNLGVALDHFGEIDAAIAQYRRCVELRPSDSASLNNLGNLLRTRGEFDEALVFFEQALQHKPDCPRAHYNRGIVWLTQGHWAKGWREVEWRLQLPGFIHHSAAAPIWDGTPLGRRVLLVYAEQGLGDTIQFIRYLPQVRERGENVFTEVQPALLPLLKQSGYGPVFAQHATLPPYDVRVSLLSLPAILETTLDNVPAQVPYVRAPEDRLEFWRGELSTQPRFKVGIVWQGSPSHPEDRFRSMPLSMFSPLANVPGVQLYSLQKGPGSEQLAAIEGAFPVVDLGSRADNTGAPFFDTAAIMQCLDLVITADTASAHLAGALGVPVWIPLRSAPDWRWMIAGERSPWYPTARLFRQTEFGNWQPVFEQMADQLRVLVRGAS